MVMSSNFEFPNNIQEVFFVLFVIVGKIGALFESFDSNFYLDSTWIVFLQWRLSNEICKWNEDAFFINVNAE